MRAHDAIMKARLVYRSIFTDRQFANHAQTVDIRIQGAQTI